MDRLFNKILFFVLMPIYGPLALFSNLTYAWWQEQKKSGILRKILFVILAPIYGPIIFFLWLTYDWWTEKGK